MANYTTNASGAIWWPNLKLIQLELSGGQICNYASDAISHLVAIYATYASDALI